MPWLVPRDKFEVFSPLPPSEIEQAFETYTIHMSPRAMRLRVPSGRGYRLRRKEGHFTLLPLESYGNTYNRPAQVKIEPLASGSAIEVQFSFGWRLLPVAIAFVFPVFLFCCGEGPVAPKVALLSVCVLGLFAMYCFDFYETRKVLRDIENLISRASRPADLPGLR